MNSSGLWRKRELSPLRRACVSLRLSVDAKPKTNLAWLLRKAGLGKTAIDYLRFSDDEKARQIVALYNSLNATERKAVTIDYLILAAGADMHHVWGCIQEELSRVEGMNAALLASVSAPGLVEKVIKRALKPDGWQDRRLLFQIAAILPVLR